MRKRNYIALIIGLALLIGAISEVKSNLDFIRTSTTTLGKVIRLNHGERHPEIAFVTQRGKQITFPASFISADVGDSVLVRYDPLMPRETARIDDFYGIWFEEFMLAVLAIAFLYAGWTGEPFRGRYG
ncbi:DUF3592 domain-containing protein [Paraburkholderia sp. Ac-20336]|uniref:DUF3592 domain-containing protein n=1 Tax=Burkholderiaceae TaxID=119060 RepID=UPI00141E00E5|nr:MULTISPECIES: DUF3592 domain-containing protein [Burkholderiaceae]MBN3803234.1 DUF3592 domain-containing protein [Paraburkholderia sp. Ac-20336]MBN3850509.1 DUF3592 domain-containing protein [Paraburkholderia sp. Ac-20342]NIF53741.1 DUF3592 domain-containing protein [Burkholderia sp. Ax-1724]